MTDFEPWGTDLADPPPYDHEQPVDTEAAAMLAEIKHRQRVSEAKAQLRVQREARRELDAEEHAGYDDTDLYLTRTQLADLPKPAHLIDQVLPRHAYAVLRGRDHSFKSFVAIDWACCLAVGKPWHRHDVDPVRVLYIAGEGAHGLASRVDAWEYGWGKKIPDHMLTIRRAPLNLHTPGPAFDHLLAHVERGRYGLVIVDTLRRVSGSAKENTSEMGEVIDNLALIRDATDDGSVLAVAHTDKGDSDSRGFSGIEDDADVVWAAKRNEDHVELELKKMKDGRDGTRRILRTQPMLDSLTLTALDGNATPDTSEAQGKVYAALRDHFTAGASRTQLREVLGDDIAKSTFYRSLKELEEAGHIANTGTSSRPFYEIPTLLDQAPADPTEDPSNDPDTPGQDTPTEQSHETPETSPTETPPWDSDSQPVP